MGALAFARRHLRGQGARAALTAAGVACGVALVVAIRVINASTLASFTDAIEDLAGSAALQVRGPGPFPEAVADELRAIPGVDHAVPIVTTTFFGAQPPVAGEALSVFAADVTDGHAIRTLHLVKAGEHVVDDPLGFLVDPRSVIVTDVLAARLGVTAGARLPLRTPHGLETFTVRGVLPPGGVGRAFGGNLILMDVVGAQLVLGEDGLIDQVDVTLAPGVRVEEVEQRLDAALPSGLEAIRPARRGEQIERYLASFQTLLSGLSGLALLAAIFVVGSAIATSVAARRRELGILRCAGAERRQVAALVLGEALATGIVGAAAGVPLGIVLARLLLRTVTESTELIFSMTVFTARLELSTWALVAGVATGVAAAVVAAWLPARDAALVSPLVAVRTAEGANPMRRWQPRGTIVAAVLLTGGALWAETRFDSPWCGNVAALAADFALVLAFMRLAGRAAALFLRPARRGRRRSPRGRGGRGPGRARAARRARLPRCAHQHRLAGRERLCTRAGGGLQLRGGRCAGGARRGARRHGRPRVAQLRAPVRRGRGRDAPPRHARRAVRGAGGRRGSRLRLAARQRHPRAARLPALVAGPLG